jgi:hypothetical protein
MTVVLGVHEAVATTPLGRPGSCVVLHGEDGTEGPDREGAVGLARVTVHPPHRTMSARSTWPATWPSSTTGSLTGKVSETQRMEALVGSVPIRRLTYKGTKAER